MLVVFKNPKSAQVTTRAKNIINTCGLKKHSAQILTKQQEHNKQTTCFPGHHNNELMATSALGHTQVQFQIGGIQECKKYSSYHLSNEHN